MSAALNAETTFKLRDAAGGVHDVKVSLEDYRQAGENHESLSTHLHRKYGARVDTQANGSVFMQLCAQTGLFLSRDVSNGIEPPSMKQLMRGGLNMGPIVSPDGGNDTAAGRLLFPELVMTAMAANLYDDHTDFLSSIEKMIAITQSIRGDQFIQPKIHLDAPRDSRAQPIAQGAEPVTMVTITTSQVTRNIPTKSIGLSITDKASGAATLDLVTLAITEQARQERVEHWEGMLADMISGNTDAGEAAIAAAINADQFDSSIAANGVCTQLAWLSWLRRYYKKMRVTHVMCDLPTALAIETRSGRPGLLKDMKLDANFTVSNLNITEPQIVLMDTAIVGANTLIGIDATKAMRRVINIEGNYEAVERFVLQRLTQYRFDYSETAHKLYSEAWDRMALINT